jgi:two-component system sensor histidine kinase/response regulator
MHQKLGSCDCMNLGKGFLLLAEDLIKTLKSVNYQTIATVCPGQYAVNHLGFLRKLFLIPPVVPMRKITQAAMLTLSSALVGLSAWRWGLGGLGLSLTAVASAGIAVLARRPTVVSPDLPGTTAPLDLPPGTDAAPDTASAHAPTTPGERTRPNALTPTPTPEPDGGGAAQRNQQAHADLALCQALAEAAHQAPNLAAALQTLGEMLKTHLGAPTWICLRVEGWNGDSGLLRPWMESGTDSNDLIDVTAMASVHKHAPALGEALTTLKPSGALTPSSSPEAAWPWRPAGTQRVLAVPVSVDGWPLAVLEFDDPAPDRPASSPVLDIAAMQLGFVAQREANQAHMANSAEHLSRLTLVASRISNGVAITDREGTIEWVNTAFMALTGWSEERVVGRKLTDLLATEVSDVAAVKELADHIARGVPFRLSYESGRQSERSITRYWGEIDAIQVLDESGGRSRYVCFFNDVTKRKAQEHIREQEREFLEALLGNLPVSLFVLDPVNLNVVAINRYTEIEFQLQRDRVVGRNLENALGKSVLRVANPYMQKAIESGETVEHDFTWHGDIGERVVNARHFALRHANGRPRLLISLVRDITAARQAQADLEESERRFRELVESMDDSVYVATERRKQVLYLSPRTADLVGVAADVLLRSPNAVRQHIVPEDLPVLADQERLEAEGLPTDMLLRMDVPQRGLRWLRHRTRTRRLPDGQLRIYGLVSDVTDEHSQALELQRARDLAEAASQAKSQFMANMSHEIRTPMNGILGMTELLLGTPLNDKQRRFAQAVYRSGESLLEIINDILDFAKIEAGRLELATSDFVLRTLVEDTLELMAPRAHEKGLELSFREQPGLPSVIHGDPLRLRQIITNLVANAIKFTEHGEVVVDIRRAIARTDSPDPRAMDLEFLVRDTGIGIPSEVIPRLFSAFVQANGGMARRYGGTGLGLAISKQLVELMGGQIEAHSAPGVGSEFVFRVPVRVGDTQIDMALVEEPGMPNFHVLVVDDNETNRTVLENMLTAWGMSVRQARHGKEALQVLEDEHAQGTDFDLALVDMNMPELDGLGLAEALQGDPRFTHLKLVLLSSVSSPDDVRRAQEAGFLRFVAKPLRKAELRQAILGISAEIGGDNALEGMLIHKHVLVVEDNPVNQEVCSQMLRRLGCEVRVASSALEGLRRLGESRFDLILMDIQMPGMDGVEALGWFRRGSSNRFNFVTPPDTPVVAVTANALEGDEQRFLNLGFNDYLSKPFRQSQLQKILVEHTHVEWPPTAALAAMEPEPSAQAPVAPSPHADAAHSPPAPDKQATAPTTAPPASPVLPDPHAPALALAPAALRLTAERASEDPATTHDGLTIPAALAELAAPAHVVLDPEALRRLRDLDPKGNNQLLDRVARAFETSIGRMLPQLEEAVKLQDQGAIVHVAHTLKSSSASIGALKLSQMCAEIEAMIRRQSGEDLTSRIRDVPVEAEQVLAALRRLLEPRA